jgi:hypothetical protein
MTILTRQTDHPGVTNKNQPLTNEEIDNNFIELFDSLEDSTPDNTPDTVVKRDEFGGFKTGIIESEGLSISSGTSGKIKIDCIETIVNTNLDTIIDSWSSSEYLSASYLIQMIQGSSYQFGEIRLIHNDIDVYLSEYSVLGNSQIGSSNTEEPVFSCIIENEILNLIVHIGNAGSSLVSILMERKLFKR